MVVHTVKVSQYPSNDLVLRKRLPGKIYYHGVVSPSPFPRPVRLDCTTVADHHYDDRESRRIQTRHDPAETLKDFHPNIERYEVTKVSSL